MKRIKTPIALFVEREGVPPNIIKSYFPSWQVGQENVNCPWHDDTKASLHIHPSGKAYCHGCNTAASDVIELVAKMEEKNYAEATKIVHDIIVDPIPESKIMAFKKVLWRNEDALAYLQINRNLTEGTINKFDLGLDPKDDRILIPIRNEFGACVNVRRMGWLKKHERKALNRKEHGEARLFPEGSLALERRVLLCEGEFDCMVARQFGLPAVTWTCGATSWNEKYNYLFQDKAVWILYDNDAGGKQGAELVVKRLDGVAYRTEVVKPLVLNLNDITDWSFNHGHELLALLQRIQDYRFPAKVQVAKICPYCRQKVPECTKT